MTDLDRYLTEEVVEKAAKARWDYDYAESGDTTEWDMRHPFFREFDTDAMRAALESVLPDIIRQAKAEALREAADGYQTGGWADDLPAGGSRPALILGMSQRAVAWLRDRADRIERGES